MPQYRIKRGGMHEAFQASRNKIQIIGGGFGNGKTAGAVVKALQLVKSYPGCNGIIAMATYSQLNDTIREEVYKWVPPSSVKRFPTMADNTMIFKNGSKINFRYIKQKGKSAAADGQTSSNLLSATYDWAVVDQIENPEITYKDFLDLLGRLRGSTAYKGTDETMPASGPRWLMLTANPSFNWVFHKLIKPMTQYKKNGSIHPDLIVDSDGKPLIDLFEAPTHENKHNLPEDFIKTLESAYTGQFYDRYVGGEWGAFEGLVYPMFNPAKHMISKKRIMDYAMELSYKGLKPEAIEGFDYGNVVPSCYMIGFRDYLGRVFILDGFYAPGMSIDQIGDKIFEMRLAYYPYINIDKPILADPAIFKKTVVNQQGKMSTTIKSLLQDGYDLMLRPGQNNITSGIAKVATYLSVDDFINFETGEMNGCLIYFADHLSWIADEFQSYFWQMSSGFERVDKPRDENDHAMDTLKYMLSYVPDIRELMSNVHLYNGEFPIWQQQMQRN